MSEETFRYKDYVGSLESSIEDQCLYGRIVNISDLVTYEGHSQAEVEAAFRSAVDTYLRKCAELGLEPERPRQRRPAALGGQ